MRLPDITNPPQGIGILTFFYLLTSILFAFAMILFYEYLDVVIFGFVIPDFFAILIKIIFVLLPLYIYFGFTRFRRIGWIVAVSYHMFFIINSILGLIYIINKNIFIKPAFQIVSKPLPDFFKYLYIQKNIPAQIIILSTGIMLGVAIIFYLKKKEDYFIY